MIDKVNLAEKFAQFSDTYNPKIVGAVNDSLVKVVKLKGDSSGIIMRPRTRCSWSCAAG